MPPKIKPRKYSWKYDHLASRWWCKETGEIVTAIQIDNVYSYEDLHTIPESFHIQLRMLMAKRNMNGCHHPNKIDVTMLGDSKTYYTCPDCKWKTPRPVVSKELPAIDDLRDWVAQQEGVVASWKVEAKVQAAESKQLKDETDALIEEVFNANR